MNSTAFSAKPVALFASVAVALVGAALLAMGTAGPAQAEVVQLERVVVLGKRAAAAAETPVIAQLPRVVITGRSMAADAVQVAAVSLKTRAL